MKIKKQFFLTATFLIIGILLSYIASSINSTSSYVTDDLDNISIDKDEEIVSVLVYLTDRVNLDSINDQMDRQHASLKDRHETVVVSLQNKAHSSQTQLVEYLEELQSKEFVKDYHCFWIDNIIRVDTYQSVVDKISKRNDVLMVYPNYGIELIAPVEESFDSEPINQNNPEPGIVAIRADEVWDLGITGEGVLVANIDTGVDGTHPALASRWAGVADPRYEGHPEWAWFDPSYGNDFPTGYGSHGTHTMGTLCGGTPGDQIGVAPGALWIASAAMIYSDENMISNIIASFEWMIDPDGDPSTNWDVPAVCSNSWGAAYNQWPPCYELFWSYLDACESAGILMVFAAGNEGFNGLRRPADRATDDYRTFAVGAVDANDPNWPIAYFSSRGPTNCTPNGSEAIKPDIAGPGVNIRSSNPGGQYATHSGTSMATPHISGVVALMRQANQNISVEQIKEIIYQTAYDLGDQGEDNSYGWGMIDAYEAVLSAMITPIIDGPINGTTFVTYNYKIKSEDPEGDDIYYWIDWDDGNSTEWIGPYISGEEIIVNHTWYDAGIYEIRAKAKTKYVESEWSEPYIVSIVENQPPDIPKISGTSQGKPGTSYDYTLNSVDPDNDDIRYITDWGDGKKDTSPFYISGLDIIASHTWSVKGTFIIKVKVEDIYGRVSPEATLSVNMPRNKAINQPFLNLLANHPNLLPMIQKIISGLRQ